jgi:Aminotransferase class I and II
MALILSDQSQTLPQRKRVGRSGSHNPTTITLDEERRHALATFARRHNVLIIEDDVYWSRLDDPPPSFATLEPELTVHVSCLSKSIAPGLRYGFVVAPQALLGQVATALRRLLEHQSAHGLRDHDSGGRIGEQDDRSTALSCALGKPFYATFCRPSTFRPTRHRRTRGFICRSRGGTWRSQERAVKEALACCQWRRSPSDVIFRFTRFASILARALGWGFEACTDNDRELAKVGTARPPGERLEPDESAGR